MQIILNTPLRDKLYLTVTLDPPPPKEVKNHLRIPFVCLPPGNLTTITNRIELLKRMEIIDENASAMDYFTTAECLFILLLHHSSLSSIKVIDG